MNPSDAQPSHRALPLVSVVIIGRNEGQRLVRCLESVAAMRIAGFAIETIYVDSASTDGSPAQAATLGAHVIEVRPERPSAALGRNAGWNAARGEFVLFLDGDTILHPEFVARALEPMRDPAVAIVWGHRRELHPEHSIYNRVLDLDWIYPPGPSDFCGGDALMRREVLEKVRGFDASLIAGEEPELCRRIRALGRTILHIDAPMTEHDLAITRFAAYWRRAFRAGHAYAEVSERFRESDDPLWRTDARRNIIHGCTQLVALMLLMASVIWPWLFLATATGALVLVSRTFWRCAWKTRNQTTRLLYALHSNFQHLPILAGQVGYFFDTQAGRRRQLIEYKSAGTT